MIVTLILLIVDWLVLCANDIPYLPLHSLYLVVLTLTLWHRPQPSSYALTLQVARQLCQKKGSPPPESILECTICGRAKPSRYYHCRHCNRCIYRLDHHCNFVGNCIGQHNSKVYLHLLVNALIHALAEAAVITYHYQSILTFNNTYSLFTLTILPALFAIYQTTRLLRAFHTTIKRNQTLVESYKRVRGVKTDIFTAMESYFGKKSLWWLIPTFASNHCCNLVERTFPLERNQEIKQYTYADEYLYGGDDEDDQYLEEEGESISSSGLKHH